MSNWPLSAYIGIILACLFIGFGFACAVINELRRSRAIRERINQLRDERPYGDCPHFEWDVTK